MKDQIVSFEISKLAKDKGFDWTTDHMYSAIMKIPQPVPYNETKWKLYHYYCLAPPQSTLQKWLRDKHRIDITVICDWQKGDRFYKVGLSYVNSNNQIDIWFSEDDLIPIKYNAYESALEEGLKHGLTLIKI